jgi:hypothetical protein
MSTVADLTPGDLVTHDSGESATFLARTRHPLWPHLELVVWRLADGSWSHDALHISQYIGQIQPADIFARNQRLRTALLNNSP